MIGVGLILAALNEFQVCFSRVPVAFWWFVVYQLAYLLLGVLQEVNDVWSFAPRVLTRVQLLLLLLIAYNLFLDKRTGERTLLVLIISCATLGILMLSGIATVVDPGGRVSVVGANPNELGMVLSLGVIALIGYAFNQRGRGFVTRALIWASFGLLSAAIISTGSRGALVALVSGILAWGLLFGSHRQYSRHTVLLVAVVCIGIILSIVYSSDIAMTRWDKALQKGDTAGREKILPASWQMFIERPLIGWGPGNYKSELGLRTGEPYRGRGAHNLYLYILIETGLAGAIPFFGALWLCLKNAWHSRQGPYGVSPLALLVVVLIANLSGDWFDRKLFWVILAYALAGGYGKVSNLSRRQSPDAGFA
jgi:O-antigen ligase